MHMLIVTFLYTKFQYKMDTYNCLQLMQNTKRELRPPVYTMMIKTGVFTAEVIIIIIIVIIIIIIITIIIKIITIPLIVQKHKNDFITLQKELNLKQVLVELSESRLQVPS